MSNYQIFPGDRLIVGRNEVVKKTVEMDRLECADPGGHGVYPFKKPSCFEPCSSSTRPRTARNLEGTRRFLGQRAVAPRWAQVR